MQLLVTGGAGFIGTNFILHYMQNHPDHTLVNLDKLTYAGSRENLSHLEEKSSYEFVQGDINDRAMIEELFRQHQFDAVINFAAESHVDRSILDASSFIASNIGGTQTLLDAAMSQWNGDFEGKRFIQISTDEVYGDLGPTGSFTEDTPLAPNSPYSASKAGADLLCRSYFKTFGLPVIITRSSNNYGPFQYPEKLIPLMIYNAYSEAELPVYGDGKNVRDWIHVFDNCRAIEAVFERGSPGEIYNIGGKSEWENIKIVNLILSELNKSTDLIRFVQDRPGHDRRYALSTNKIEQELGWRPVKSFEEGLRETIDWYLDHMDWLKQKQNADHQSYLKANYEEKFKARL